MFKTAWSVRMTQAEGLSRELKIEIKNIDKQIEGLLDRIVETTTPSVITAYETRLTKLEREKLVLAEKLRKNGQTALGFDEMFELAIQFLSNPCKLWDSGQLHLKRLVLRLVFSERIAYCRKGGLRTPKTSLPFKLLNDLSMGKREMAEREGFEPSERLHAQRFSRPPHSTTLAPLLFMHFQQANAVAWVCREPKQSKAISWVTALDKQKFRAGATHKF